MAKSPEELFKERTKRVEDAIQLKVPDRVPITPYFGFFPAMYAGITCEEAMYDQEKLWMASKKAIFDFEPDMYVNPYDYVSSGPVAEALDYKQLRWPGHGVSPHHSYQFVEGEYMKAEEYDHFLDDLSDFMIRNYFPRICGALKPFGELAPIHDSLVYYLGLFINLAPLGMPNMAKSLKALSRAGTAALKWATAIGSFDEEMKGLGFPSQFGSITHAPFDTIGDFFRGTRGVMLDMYKCPEKLLKAMDKITPMAIQMAVSYYKQSGNPRTFIPLHKGADSFMSQTQFKTFYWPTLREVLIGIIEEGLQPIILVEGNYNSRLEAIRDVPKGKLVYHFESTDIFKAKEVLGDVACIRGNVPLALLFTGTPQDIRDYCKKLIDVVGKGGGFMMDAAGCIDEAKPENIKAMIDFTKEYGTYG